MDITILAAWGEFLGGIAVVVSLVYLASQIRQNSRLLRSSTASASSVLTNETSGLLAQDSEIARIFDDGMVDRSSLSATDKRRFDSLLSMMFGGFNQEYQFSVDGVIGDVVWVGRIKTFRRLLQQTGFRQYWNEWRDIYGDEFCELVDDLIREGEAAR